MGSGIPRSVLVIYILYCCIFSKRAQIILLKRRVFIARRQPRTRLMITRQHKGVPASRQDLSDDARRDRRTAVAHREPPELLGAAEQICAHGFVQGNIDHGRGVLDETARALGVLLPRGAVDGADERGDAAADHVLLLVEDDGEALRDRQVDVENHDLGSIVCVEGKCERD